ncbi:CaiB/BaiF CoA transferase family protein [Advenella mimigardefordensis]|uniref:Putative acyl-CoA transferase family 3 n=1 Tax=Advenella mimigardefordensis (strain DSM 17166 / LMG 22922 / DPN7) TaxID=1247726 RepID=W0PGG0_ADVMD|nr:CoA transferase [Advenella mimigardefordensis]AHG64717.1 putative acyl-CoA transferase family 3 [Advenella mimigardefordensis DPN7]
MKQESTLQGVKVIEVCNVAAGPFCSMLLADMGADVIKIENPNGGDTLRSWPPISDGYSENFASLNRNKKSITLNLKDPADVKAARRLMCEADIVLENNRPGVMDRLGLGFADIKALNPQIVYCSISAYGQSGPRSQEGGFDLTVQAMSGLMSITGEADGAPVKCGVPVCDFSAGLYAAFSIVSALRMAEKSGEGTHIDVSMLGATLGIAALQTSEYFGSGNNPRKMGSAHPRNAPYQVFRCKDGYFGMAAGNNSLWKSVCQVVNRPELYDDERFTSTLLRAQHQQALLEILEVIFAAEPAEHWLSAFRAAGVPCAPINQYSDILADEQVAHMEWVQDIPLPNGLTANTFASPIRFDGKTSRIAAGPPALGQHNEEILSSIAPQGEDA